MTICGPPGAAHPCDVVAAEAGAAFPRAALYRARRALGPAIEDQGQGPRDPHKRWRLAPEPPPPTPESIPESQ